MAALYVLSKRSPLQPPPPSQTLLHTFSGPVFSSPLKTLWVAAQPSALSTTAPNCDSSVELLMVCSVLSVTWLIVNEKQYWHQYWPMCSSEVTVFQLDFGLQITTVWDLAAQPVFSYPAVHLFFCISWFVCEGVMGDSAECLTTIKINSMTRSPLIYASSPFIVEGCHIDQARFSFINICYFPSLCCPSHTWK